MRYLRGFERTGNEDTPRSMPKLRRVPGDLTSKVVGPFGMSLKVAMQCQARPDFASSVIFQLRHWFIVKRRNCRVRTLVYSIIDALQKGGDEAYP